MIRYKRTVTCSVCNKEEWVELASRNPIDGALYSDEYGESPPGWAKRQEPNRGYWDTDLCSIECKEKFIIDTLKENRERQEKHLRELFSFGPQS